MPSSLVIKEVLSLHLEHFTGFGLAFLSMVLYGLYMAPRRQTGVAQSTFTFWMGIGILAATILLGLVLDGFGSVTLVQYVTMFICGLVWATGTHTYCLGVQLIGLSRSTPIKNISAMLGTLLGVFILHEFPNSGLSAGLVILGSAAVMISAIILGRVEASDDADQHKQNSRYYIYGVLCSSWAAVAYSVWTIPMKHLYQQGVTPSQFLVYMSHGCFAGMALIALFTRPRGAKQVVTWRDRGLAQLSGVMWAIGSLCANIAVKYVGVAVTWPITKNTLVAVLFGVYVLKEIDAAKHKRGIRYGLALSILGAFLLGLGVSKR